MYQFLDNAQHSVSNLAAYWNGLPAAQRAGASFVGGIVLVYLCIKDRDVEYTSIAMGLGALLLFAYALTVTVDLLQ